MRKYTNEFISEISQKLNDDNLTRKEIIEEYGFSSWEQLKDFARKHNISYSKTQPTGFIYKCKYCEKEFTDRRALAGHTTMCAKNPKQAEHLKNLEKARQNIVSSPVAHNVMKCEYCGKEVHGAGCLARHKIWCKKNPNRGEWEDEYIKRSEKLLEHARKKLAGKASWNRGETKFTNKSLLEASKKLKDYYKTHDGTFCGKKHTAKAKEKLRLKMIENIEACSGQMQPRYSKKGCEFINRLNETKGWNLQHAENGGEFSVSGYYIDGYDKERNIAFEYDEPKHYEDTTLNILKKKDIERQNLIIEKLGCKLYRYNEAIDFLYCVNE